MDNILALSEEDIKLRYITPSILQKGWSVEDITMETKVKLTDGKINLRGNLVARGKAKFADYVLYYNRATPIAIVEAKDANHTVSFGMQQAKEYAQMMDIPFAFSSNGQGYQEYDFLTGKERSFSMDAFPTKEELYARFLTESNGGKGFSDEEKKIQFEKLLWNDDNNFSGSQYDGLSFGRNNYDGSAITMTVISKTMPRLAATLTCNKVDVSTKRITLRLTMYYSYSFGDLDHSATFSGLEIKWK